MISEGVGPEEVLNDACLFIYDAFGEAVLCLNNACKESEQNCLSVTLSESGILLLCSSSMTAASSRIPRPNCVPRHGSVQPVGRSTTTRVKLNPSP